MQQKTNPPASANGSGAMFDGIAKRYDLLNRCTSLGLDGYWRRRLLRSLQLASPKADDVVLDLATGTADVALALLRRAPQIHVVGVDPSEQMLAIGRSKWQHSCAAAGQQLAQLQLLTGDAQALAHADDAFCAASMAFGIRNVPDRNKALRELRRVVRSGGRVGILELTEPRDGLLGAAARFYVHRVVPQLGAWLSGAGAYRYLAQSIAAFVTPEKFVEMMQDAGFVDVRAERLSFGAAHIFVGVVP